MQEQSNRAQATSARAFGGSRQGIAQQELNRNLMQTQNQAIAQSLQGGYGQALSTAQQQQQAGLGAYGQLGNMGQGIGSLAGQQFGIGSQMAQGLGSLGGQLGQLGVQQGAVVRLALRGQRMPSMAWQIRILKTYVLASVLLVCCLVYPPILALVCRVWLDLRLSASCTQHLLGS
jgi:hypothetical protein